MKFIFEIKMVNRMVVSACFLVFVSLSVKSASNYKSHLLNSSNLENGNYSKQQIYFIYVSIQILSFEISIVNKCSKVTKLKRIYENLKTNSCCYTAIIWEIKNQILN